VAFVTGFGEMDPNRHKPTVREYRVKRLSYLYLHVWAAAQQRRNDC